MSTRMIQLNHQLMEKLLKQAAGMRALSAGRVVVLNSVVSFPVFERIGHAQDFCLELTLKLVSTNNKLTYVNSSAETL